MPSLDKIVEELQFLSDRLSAQVRMLGLGMIAFVWALLSGTGGTFLKFTAGDKRQLAAVAALSLLAMLLDFLQYACGYCCADSLHRKLLKEGKACGDYSYRDWRYVARKICFWAKQVTVFVGAAWLIWLVGGHLVASLGSGGPPQAG